MSLIESGKDQISTPDGRRTALVIEPSAPFCFPHGAESSRDLAHRRAVGQECTLSSRLHAVSCGNSLAHRYRVHQGSLTSTAAGSAGLSLITIEVVEVDAVQVVLRPHPPPPPACVRLEAGCRFHPGPIVGYTQQRWRTVFTFCVD